MTTPPECSFSFSTAQANKVFPNSHVDSLVLALLAGIPPQPGWEGCLVFQAGSQPSDVRVGLRGPAALAIRDCLVDSITRIGIDLLPQEDDDELAMEAPIARIEGGAWC
jgi:hypothetical protein